MAATAACARRDRAEMGAALRAPTLETLRGSSARGDGRFARPPYESNLYLRGPATLRSALTPRMRLPGREAYSHHPVARAAACPIIPPAAATLPTADAGFGLSCGSPMCSARV